MIWNHLESEIYKLQTEMDKNQEEKKRFKWTQQRNIKKGKISSEINNKLGEAQSRKGSNDKLIKGIKERQKNNQAKTVT